MLAGLRLAGAEPADLEALLKGVTEIVAPGAAVGPVAVFGDKAFPVMTGRNGKARLPVLAAARWGKGRVVLAGHEGLYGTTQRPDQRQLIVNTATWLAGDRPKPIRVLVVDHRQVAPVLKEAGFEVSVLGVGQLADSLPKADVLFVSGNQFTAPDRGPLRDAVAAFIEGGGGYFDGIPGWGWQQLNPRLSLPNDHGGNRLTAQMGLVIADGIVGNTGKEGFLADRSGLDLTHAGRALAALERQANDGPKLSKDDLAQVGATLTSACAAVPDGDTLLLPKLHALIAKQGEAAVPMPKQPLGLDNPIGRIACVLQNAEMRRTPAEKLKAHPAAAGFPGPVPPEARRVERTVTVDTAVPDWASTGLYAAPGEALEVTLPPEAAKAGLGLRIGAHTDHIWGHDRWSRFPEISYATALTAPTTRFGNPFGGIVYITVPRGCKLGRIEVRIKGAVEMPYFVQGETPLHLWRTEIRKRPAPFAELATRKIILIIPASVVRGLDDPEALMNVWDAGLDAIADLAAMPRDRERPERICSDQQISAGYMHSGYPIMTFLDVPPTMVDRDKLVKGGASTCWGFWHELGHNHQSGHWTFGGTGETTVNLFSLYCCERVSNEPVAKNSWLNPPQRNKTVAKYFADGAKFEDWCRDPALSLMFYAQLQQAFGWGAYQRVFAGYRAARSGDLPHNDDQKRDQFLVRFSREVGRDLGPFFTAWGIPTSEAARKSLAGLPVWLPPDFKSGIPFTLDP
ncbi:MAG TPA: M60 family metallopeptidase [Planctomycetota bacterium]|nr:M60 family metallopeptidase [Planctomycetota bacterium]HRR79131.1 M60 family metallopeptidase [Planctomycetota bacterium]